MLYVVTLIRLETDSSGQPGVAILLTSDLESDFFVSAIPQGWFIAFKNAKAVMEIISSSGPHSSDLETMLSWGFDKLLGRSPGNALYLGAHDLSQQLLTNLGYRGPV
jgi:hypothetical protein